MAFGYVGGAGTANSNSSGTTLALTVSATIEAGNLALVLIAKDNFGTTDADHSEVSSVTDSAGNTYAKMLEFTNGNGSAGAGATNSIWASVLASQLSSGVGVITATFANAITCKAMLCHEFTVGAGSTLSVAGSTSNARDATSPGSLTVSGLASGEYLWVRGIASESDNFTGLTVTSGYATLGLAAAIGGSSALSMASRGEYRILTATSSTSNPSLFNADHACVMVAIQEIAAVAGHPAMRRLGRQPFRPVEIGRKSPGGVWAVQYGVARLPGVLVAA